LNFEFYGNDFKNNINAFFACSILLPYIEPDLSSTNIYSPVNLSKFDLPVTGRKNVKAAHSSATVHNGYVGFYLSKLKHKSFYGIFG
jgi:hypothetical protein